jgi:Domain of unknown function (DUF5004)
MKSNIDKNVAFLFKNIKMKPFLLSFIFALSICAIKAQTISDVDIVGKWKVVSTIDLSQEISKKDAEVITKAKKIFEKVIFNFGADKKFSFDIAVPELQIKSAYWSLKTKEGIIRISTTKAKTNKELLMQIKYKKEGDKMVFAMEEMPFFLVVEKL